MVRLPTWQCFRAGGNDSGGGGKGLSMVELKVYRTSTPVIQLLITESLKNVVLAKSSSQPQSTYEAARSLTEFELKKILVDKIEKSKSYQAAPKHRELYDGLVKSYNLDKDLFSSYGNVYSLKRDREDEDKDEDPPTGSNQGLKKRKTSNDAELPKGSKSKESNSSSSKGTKPQAKSSGKSTQVEEPVFEAADTEMQQDQGSKFGHAVDKPNGEAAPKSDWFKKPNKPSTPDRAWNTTKSIDFRPPQTWISNIAKAREPPCMFDELMSTLIDFSAYVMNHLKIDNLTQKILVGSAFNLLKGSCKSHEYPFDLSKPLPLIEVQGRQVVPADYFFNNDLEYLKGGSSSRKYTTSTTKTKAAKYDNIEGIKDMVPTLWSPVKWYDYGYLEEIIIQRDDQKLYKFMEVDFPRVNLRDIEDLLLLLVQNKLSNLEKDVIFDLNVALRMFTRRVVILKRVEDLQLAVKSYQKKLNLTKPVTFRYDISKMTPYTAYKNPQGIIYLGKYQRNRLMRSDELYKFCDEMLKSVINVHHDIAN
ncbi:hypothetical protein Tco_0012783, partial [Tanacetum coccineum]